MEQSERQEAILDWVVTEASKEEISDRASYWYSNINSNAIA